jgi:hypothetical protein
VNTAWAITSFAFGIHWAVIAYLAAGARRATEFKLLWEQERDRAQAGSLAEYRVYHPVATPAVPQEPPTEWTGDPFGFHVEPWERTAE